MLISKRFQHRTSLSFTILYLCEFSELALRQISDALFCLDFAKFEFPRVSLFINVVVYEISSFKILQIFTFKSTLFLPFPRLNILVHCLYLEKLFIKWK